VTASSPITEAPPCAPLLVTQIQLAVTAMPFGPAKRGMIRVSVLRGEAHYEVWFTAVP
jgi:hypothetical protein